MNKIITASILIIGNEILNGSVQDNNSSYLAGELIKLGISTKHIRVVADIEDEIIYHVNELKKSYDYLFTTGGIGPTHDDITAQSIAKAFNVKLYLHEPTKDALIKYYSTQERGEERLKAALKMAYIPEGCGLIYNPISPPPGFYLENVYVMAGIPNIMRAMFDDVKPKLKGGAIIQMRSLEVQLGESIIAQSYSQIQQRFKEVEMGSYPFTQDGKWCTKLVLRSHDIETLEKAFDETKKMVLVASENYIS